MKKIHFGLCIVSLLSCTSGLFASEEKGLPKLKSLNTFSNCGSKDEKKDGDPPPSPLGRGNGNDSWGSEEFAKTPLPQAPLPF